MTIFVSSLLCFKRLFSDASVNSTESIRYLIPSYIQDSHSLQDWCRLVEVFHQKLAGKTKAGASLATFLWDCG